MVSTNARTNEPSFKRIIFISSSLSRAFRSRSHKIKCTTARVMQTPALVSHMTEVQFMSLGYTSALLFSNTARFLLFSHTPRDLQTCFPCIVLLFSESVDNWRQAAPTDEFWVRKPLEKQTMQRKTRQHRSRPDQHSTWALTTGWYRGIFVTGGDICQVHRCPTQA